MLSPPLLGPGARVALIAPAGPLRNEEELERAAGNARSFGWEPAVGANALARSGYFAGTDVARLGDLERALSDDSIAGIWCLRGGYGAMRLLNGIDYAALRRRPRAFIGFSDITALHCAIAHEVGLVTFHGPTARARLSDFSRDSLGRAVVRGTDSCGEAPDARLIRPGSARGSLAGGNLALLAALAGTPWAPSFRGAIVVLEDVNEPMYRIDRMLTQLRLAGMLDGCVAIAAGHFTACPENSDDGARALDEVLAETADALGVPCIAGIPMGHIDDQWTIPLGATAEIDVEARRLAVCTAPR